MDYISYHHHCQHLRIPLVGLCLLRGGCSGVGHGDWSKSEWSIKIEHRLAFVKIQAVNKSTGSCAVLPPRGLEIVVSLGVDCKYPAPVYKEWFRVETSSDYPNARVAGNENS